MTDLSHARGGSPGEGSPARGGTPVESFTPDVVAAIVRHMNEDHADDTLLIFRALGNQPDAESATMASVDAEGADFVGQVNGADVPVRLVWRERLTERKQVRQEVIHLYHQAVNA